MGVLKGDPKVSRAHYGGSLWDTHFSKSRIDNYFTRLYGRTGLTRSGCPIWALFGPFFDGANFPLRPQRPLRLKNKKLIVELRGKRLTPLRQPRLVTFGINP